MKKTVALFTSLALALIFGCGKSKEGDHVLTVQNYVGSVMIQGGAGGRLPEIGGPVAEGETVDTGALSSVDLVYNESALVRINENSSVSIDSLMARIKNSTGLSLKQGSIFTVVSKLKDDEDFRVTTQTMVVAVRGTSFRVSSVGNSSETEILAGTVKVNPVQDGTMVADVSNEVGENSRAEIKKEQVREIIRDRRIAVTAISAERRKRLRDDLDGIDGAVVDRLNPGLRKEYRMKLLEMKQDRFEMMESQREERMRRFLEKKKEGGARIKERSLEGPDSKQERKTMFEKLRGKKEKFIEKRREQKKAAIEKRNEKREEQKMKREDLRRKRGSGN